MTEGTTTICRRIPFIGDRVQVLAADDEYAVYDGWRGTVQGLDAGVIEVEFIREEGTKTLFVRAAQLAMID